MGAIYLRALSRDDLELTHKWHSDKSMYQTLEGPFRYVCLEAEKEWLENRIKYNNNEVNLIICLQENDQSIGMVSVREIDWVSRIGVLGGIFIGEPEQRGNGYGTQALHLTLHHCFMDLGIHRIWTTILESNTPSLSVFRKCGFQVEAQLRQEAFKNGGFENSILVGILAEDYSSETNHLS